MEESYEYAIEFGKQGGKNPPKITINRELFSRAIEKKIYIRPRTILGYLKQTILVKLPGNWHCQGPRSPSISGVSMRVRGLAPPCCSGPDPAYIPLALSLAFGH